jgi:hypothetical protein
MDQTALFPSLSYSLPHIPANSNCLSYDGNSEPRDGVEDTSQNGNFLFGGVQSGQIARAT